MLSFYVFSDDCSVLFRNFSRSDFGALRRAQQNQSSLGRTCLKPNSQVLGLSSVLGVGYREIGRVVVGVTSFRSEDIKT